jgi:hypothetical protein
MMLMASLFASAQTKRYQWRLLLEEYAPETVNIKGIHNTVADAISRLEYNSVQIDQRVHALSRANTYGRANHGSFTMDDFFKTLAPLYARQRHSKHKCP